MAIPFLNNITLNNNEIQNVRLQNGGNPPLNSGPGQIYFDSTPSDLTAKYYSNITDEFVSLKEYSFPTDTYITGTVTGTTPKPIITFDLNAVDGTASANERYLTKNNTWATVASIPGTYSWTVAGDSGSESVLSGDTISFIGGTNVTTAYNAVSNELTINSTDQFQGTVTSVNFTTDGNALNVVSNTITTYGTMTGVWQGTSSQYVNGEGDLQDVASIPGTYEWDIAGDSGSGTVGSGDTINFAGGTNVTTAYSGTTLTINSTDQFQGTLTGITEGPGITVTPSATSPTVAVDYLGVDNYLLEAGAATVADSDDIINFSDDDDSNVKKTTLGTIPVESLTLVKNYIDSSASGGVYYQGGYNPTTDLTSPGNYGLQTPPNPNIIEIGWMYTVTADGTFFGEQLRIGDVLIAEVDAPTSLSDWTTVQNNIDFATAGTDTGASAAIVGISRYDQDDFTVSSTGFVQLTVPAARSGSIAVPNSATYTYPSSITASATNSVLIQLVDGGTGETVYADVTRLSTTTFSVNYGVTTPTDVIALIQLIG
jgi:hypothetical protein